LWILLGKRVWFFPNINAEETTFRELVRFWPEKDEGEPPKWTSRIFYALVAMVIILLLRHHAPDEAARARYNFFFHVQVCSGVVQVWICSDCIQWIASFLFV
jgi:hypothetical protein